MKLAFESEPNSDIEINQDGTLRIGPFLFTSDISLTLKRRLNHLYRPIKNKVQALRMQNGRLAELIPDEALQLAESYNFLHLQQLQLENNKLYQISFFRKCNFPNLLVLNLGRNYLQNLTDIWNHLNFPNLEEFYLHNNYITTLKGIQRWRLPLLSKLTFELNFIASIKDIFEAELPSLRELTLYSNDIRDFKPIFKAKFPNLQSLQIYENSACNQFFICSALPNKFKFLETISPQNDG